MQLDRLAAQRQRYTDAKRLQVVVIVAAVPAVIAWSLLTVWQPAWRGFAAFWGVGVALLDMAVLTPLIRKRRLEAARIQELFDCEVLELEWSDLKVGPRPDAEVVMEAASRAARKNPNHSGLKNWYPVAVGELPMHLARIVCQRANCWWDAKVRRRYAATVLMVLGVLAAIVFLLGMLADRSLESLLLSVVVPLFPAVLLAARQCNEHLEAANSADRLKGYAEDLWSDGLAGGTSPSRLRISSRRLQDEIFDRRRESPLVFDWIYQRFQRPREALMNRGAEELVKEALEKARS